MENVLAYYYNINIDKTNKINNNYYFFHKNNNYVFHIYEREIEEAEELYDLNEYIRSLRLPSYKIILTNQNNILVEYEKNFYVLMIMPNINNRIIKYDDLKIKIPIQKEYKYINKSNWKGLWERKVDYIENQFFQTKNKYPIISENINYYIGMWENAISYNIDNTKAQSTKFLSTRRIKIDTDLIALLNPLEFVIDTKERIIGDYLKSFVMNENYTKLRLEQMLNTEKFTKEEIINLLSRILFPSYYFDLYESIINNKKSEKEISKIDNKNIIQLINIIGEKYRNYNIPIIYWIKKEE